eukprot:EG_transcript_13453
MLSAAFISHQDCHRGVQDTLPPAKFQKVDRPFLFPLSPKWTFSDPGDGLEELQLGDLHPLASLPYNGVPDHTPPFVGTQWVRCTAVPVVAEESAKGASSAPVGFVRYALGGKSRCLQELGAHLSARLHTPVLYITFDGATRMHVSPASHTVLQSLLDRIAFAVKTATAPDCGLGTEALVEAWLGTAPCLLLLDDLHLLLPQAAPRHEVEECAAFLCAHFLDRPGRHFVFTSSHRKPLERLEACKALRGRKVRLLQLPLMTPEFDPDGGETAQFMAYLKGLVRFPTILE